MAITSVSYDIEKLESSYIAGETFSAAALENQFTSFSKS